MTPKPSILFKHILPAAITMAWITGIFCRTFGAGWWWAAIFCALAIFLTIKRLHIIAFALFAYSGGWLVADLHQPEAAPDWIYDGKPRNYIATVIKTIGRPSSQTTILAIDSVAINGKMTGCRRFKIKASSLPDWSIFVGERLRITAILEPLDHHSDFQYDRNSRSTDLREGVSAQTFLKESDIHCVGEVHSAAWWLNQRREAIIRILSQSDISDKTFGILSAITVGYSDELDEDIRENFRAAGIAHSLALSGFHVGIIVLLVTFVLFPLRSNYRLRQTRFIISLILIWFYALMVGMPESVVRAVIMLSIILIAKIFGQKTSTFSALCVAVIVILAYSPFSLFSSGFQLSVFAVLGIIALSEKLNPFNPNNRGAYLAAEFFTVPISAILGTMVVTISTFHRLPILFLASNLVISLLLPVIMIGGIGLIILVECGFKALWLCKVMDWLSDIIDGFTDYIANLEFAELPSIYLSNAQIIALIACILAIIIAVNHPTKKMFFATSTIYIAALLVIIFSGEKFSDNESFIIRQSTNTPIVYRDGRTLHAIFTVHPRHFENARKRFLKRTESYRESRGVDTVRIYMGDFTAGPFSRHGNIIELEGVKIGLAAAPGGLDSIQGKTDYALICSRFNGCVEDVVAAFNPDTILISRDVSLHKNRKYLQDSPVPIINLRESDSPISFSSYGR